MQVVLRQESERITITNGSVANLPDLVANVRGIRPSAIVHVAANVDVPALLRDPYLEMKPPKSTGREYYGQEFVRTLLQKARKLVVPSARPDPVQSKISAHIENVRFLI